MDTKELRKLKTDELKSRLELKTMELRDGSFDLKIAHSNDTSSISKLRKNEVARIQTILREREISGE